MTTPLNLPDDLIAWLEETAQSYGLAAPELRTRILGRAWAVHLLTRVGEEKNTLLGELFDNLDADGQRNRSRVFLDRFRTMSRREQDMLLASSTRRATRPAHATSEEWVRNAPFLFGLTAEALAARVLRSARETARIVSEPTPHREQESYLTALFRELGFWREQ